MPGQKTHTQLCSYEEHMCMHTKLIFHVAKRFAVTSSEYSKWWRWFYWRSQHVEFWEYAPPSTVAKCHQIISLEWKVIFWSTALIKVYILYTVASKTRIANSHTIHVCRTYKNAFQSFLSHYQPSCKFWLVYGIYQQHNYTSALLCCYLEWRSRQCKLVWN